jgi:hypothetical protein
LLLLVQIIIAFDKRFWPAQLYDVVCTHTFVPELWMTQHDVIDGSSKHLHAVVGAYQKGSLQALKPVGLQHERIPIFCHCRALCNECAMSANTSCVQPKATMIAVCDIQVTWLQHQQASWAKASQPFMLYMYVPPIQVSCLDCVMCLWATGFIAGERATALSKMQPAAAVQKFLDQLDEMFGSSQQPRPASAAYVKAHIFDWAQEPYVGGAYSYPSLGAHDGDREALAAPVAGTVFFAGEWASLVVNSKPKLT